MSRINTRSITRPVLKSLAALTLALLPILPARAQTFATSVVSSSGLGSNALYNNPAAALGQPTTLINGIFDVPQSIYHTSLVYAPYATDPSGNDVIVSLGATGSVTVKFDTPIVHSDQHWYGDDFIVFGNSTFTANSGITPTTNMANVLIGSTGGIYQNGTPTVKVSADGINFTTLAAPTWYPTNSYYWSGDYAVNPSGWDDSRLEDFTRPLNPNLTPASFGGATVAYAANTLYGGSAGGAAFSLVGILDTSGNPLTSIQYIQFNGGSGGGTFNIDAVSRVSFASNAVPEPGAAMVFAIGLLGCGFLRRRGRQA